MHQSGGPPSRGSMLEEGFIGAEAQEGAREVRNSCADTFECLDDFNRVIMNLARAAMSKPDVRISGPDGYATRLLLRSAGHYQAAVILLERAMITEARIMARLLWENAFCVVALINAPEEMAEWWVKDLGIATRRTIEFLIERRKAEGVTDEDLVELHSQRTRYNNVAFMNFKLISAVGSLKGSYTLYNVLTNEAGHPTATALQNHLRTTSDGVDYNFGPGSRHYLDKAVADVLLPSVSVAVGVYEVMGLAACTDELTRVMQRLEPLLIKGRAAKDK